MSAELAVVIPALNERQHLPALLRDLTQARAGASAPVHIVVVDGGSVDETATLAEPLADQVIHSPTGRARQMNAGAVATQSPGLWFLHADARLEPGVIRSVLQTLHEGHAWGRFDLRLDGTHWMLPVIAASINARSRLSGIATGDQGLFMTRAVFDAVGGFPDQPLMEDIAMSAALKDKAGPPACCKGPLGTAGRRWEANGVWRTIGLMWWLRWRYWCGADPRVLARQYDQETV